MSETQDATDNSAIPDSVLDENPPSSAQGDESGRSVISNEPDLEHIAKVGLDALSVLKKGSAILGEFSRPDKDVQL